MIKFTYSVSLLLILLNAAHAQTGNGSIQMNPSSHSPVLDSGSAPVDQTFSYVQQMPKPDYDLLAYFRKHLFPPDTVAEGNLTGRVIVQFVVNEDGSISGSKVVKSLCTECDEVALELIRTMPPWQPGKKDGNPVKVYCTQPVNFTGSKAYFFVQQMPEPGYDFNKYEAQNLHYPQYAQQRNIQGQVIARFIVNRDGTISDCEIVRGIGGYCDEEVLKLIKNMPPWKPGKQAGRAVKVYYVKPVNFTLTQNKFH